MTDNDMRNNDNDDDHASYTITRRTQIIDTLMQMERQSVLINVKPVSGAEKGLMTTITRILPDKNLFSIDVSADAQLNHALENCGEVLFTATVNGVPTRFNVPGLTPATLGGHPVFAVSIPVLLYWRQRRRAYRLPIPLATPITCTLPVPGLSEQKFRLLDISQLGFLVLNENQRAGNVVDVGQFFSGCQFSWPATLKDPFSAELCRSEAVGSSGIFRSFKHGFRIIKMTPAFEKGIQDLLFELALFKKKQKEMVPEDRLTGRSGR
jgi:flagellar brake protein